MSLTPPDHVQRYNPTNLPEDGMVVVAFVRTALSFTIGNIEGWQFAIYHNGVWWMYEPFTGMAHEHDRSTVLYWCHPPSEVIDFFDTWCGRCYQARVDCAQGISRRVRPLIPIAAPEIKYLAHV